MNFFKLVLFVSGLCTISCLASDIEQKRQAHWVSELTNLVEKVGASGPKSDTLLRQYTGSSASLQKIQTLTQYLSYLKEEERNVFYPFWANVLYLHICKGRAQFHKEFDDKEDWECSEAKRIVQENRTIVTVNTATIAGFWNNQMDLMETN